MSFRALITLLCGCFIVTAAATNPVSAQQPLVKCGYNAETKTCGGFCLKFQTCTIKPGSTQCSCQPVAANTCKYNETTKTCGGSCPEGTTCTIKPGSTACSCKSPEKCGYNVKTKTCGGSCPPGRKCRSGPKKESCVCDD
jgi:hypothetical protein